MVQPLTIIIHNDERVREKLASALKDNPQLGFHVEKMSYSGWESYNSTHPEAAQAYFLGNGTDSYLRLAKTLKESSPEAARVFVSPLYENSDHNPGDTPFDDRIPQDFNITDIANLIEGLRQNKRLTRRLSIGIWGSGRLAEGILSHSFNDDKTVRDIYHFSRFLTRNRSREEREVLYRELYNRAGIPEHEETRVIKKYSLGDLIDSKPDVLFIATGKYMGIEALRQNPTRREWFQYNYPIVEPSFKDLQRSGSLIVWETNPPGPIINMGVRKYGLDPFKNTSFSADTYRYQTVLRSLLHQYVGPGESSRSHELSGILKNVRFGDIDISVIGEHGEDIPHLASIAIKGRLFRDLIERVYEDETTLRSDLMEGKSRLGTQALEQVLKHGGTYPDTPKAILECLIDIANFKPKLRYSAHCPIDSGGISLNWPTKVTYQDDKVLISPDNEKLKMGDLSEFELREIARQIEDNRHYIVTGCNLQTNHGAVVPNNPELVA